MVILHIHITGPFNEDATYQENQLIAEQVKLGHDVIIWTSCYEWSGTSWIYVEEQRKVMDNGVVLQRLKYHHYFNDFLTKKIRNIPGVYERLVSENPDIIMIHGAQTVIIPEVCRFLDMNPHVKMVLDSHSDKYNTATNFFSKYILHKMFYKIFMKKAYEYASKVFYISAEAKDFLCDMYKLSDAKMEFLPLGGTVFDDKTYKGYRYRRRQELHIADEVINIVHSGKLFPEKKTTELLQVFSNINRDDIHLTIIGSATGKELSCIECAANNDSRISWLGWKPGNELLEYLCAGDIYVLPGDLSATVQSAMCCRCGIMVYPYDNYRALQLDRLCYISDMNELEKNIRTLLDNDCLVKKMRNDSLEYAKNKLDYSEQAKKIIDLV